MKKHYFILLLLSTFVVQSNAQEIWLEAALKGGVGSSFLLNQNIIDDPDYRYRVKPMYGGGAKLAVNFGPWHGIALEGLYNISTQEFDYQTPGSSSDLLNEIQWKSIDAYLLYRYITNRVYVEIGPMYSFIQSVEQKNDGVEVLNASDLYEDAVFGGAFGFGGYVAGTETFSLGLGFRVNYGFTDFVNSRGQAANLPALKPYENEVATHPLFAQFLVEFNFGLGYWAPSSCGQRMKFSGPGR